MFDVLIYLFENYLDPDFSCVSDPEVLRTELHGAGFARTQVNAAFDWLDHIALHSRGDPSQARIRAGATRVYHPRELAKLDIVCRGFLQRLENMRVLSAAERELVIDRAMALDEARLDLDRLKWVVLMVLLNQPEHDARLAWIEHLLFDSVPGNIH